MTDKLRAAAQAALETLKNLHGAKLRSGLTVKTEPTAMQLRAVLAEPEAKQLPPLPECYVTSGGRDLWREEDLIAYGRACAALAESPVKDHLTAAEPYLWYADDTGDTWTPEAVADGYAPTDLRPLYTLPPRREWVTLTDEEIEAAIRPLCGENESVLKQLLDFSMDEYRAIEAALKEKNG